MANTYTQLHIHLVFAVKFRTSLIRPEIREEVEKYICGIIQRKHHKLLAIYLMPDHAHIFIGLNPQESISTLVQVIKTASTNFIKDKRLTGSPFYWQEGFGAFSHSKSEVPWVIKYILNQPEHHKKKTFREEYLDILKSRKIDFNPKYLFDFFD